jgi:hypothetical protein
MQRYKLKLILPKDFGKIYPFALIFFQANRKPLAEIIRNSQWFSEM